MNPAPSLIALAFLVYAQSGMPGLGAFEFLVSLLKSHTTSPVNRDSDSEESTTLKEPDRAQNNEEFSSPVSVNNDNVEEASVSIEINHHQHHHYHNETSDHREALSDGGPKRDDD